MTSSWVLHRVKKGSGLWLWFMKILLKHWHKSVGNSHGTLSGITKAYFSPQLNFQLKFSTSVLKQLFPWGSYFCLSLQSKRIGHFFFWYVRSEVAGCPYFRQRMAVILEAYLLGCGQAMIDSFTQQVQAVEALQEVAMIIKRLYPDKTDLPSSGWRFNHVNVSCGVWRLLCLFANLTFKINTVCEFSEKRLKR